MKKRENESYLSEVLSKLTEHKMAMVGLFVITLEIILVAYCPPLSAAPSAFRWD